MNSKYAEDIALRSLTWLASQDELITQFLGMTGASVQDLRQRAQDPEFLGFIMDFILSSDETVIECAQSIDLAPESLLSARQALVGGDDPHWT